MVEVVRVERARASMFERAPLKDSLTGCIEVAYASREGSGESRSLARSPPARPASGPTWDKIELNAQAA